MGTFFQHDVSYREIRGWYKMLVFTALLGMETRSSDENSVCPSVCPSVKRVICDKMEERSVQIFISYKNHLA